MENRKEMRRYLLQALLFSVVTGLASTISANASNDSIKTIAFDKLRPNPDKPFPILPIDSAEGHFLPIHPDKPLVPVPMMLVVLREHFV